MLVPVYAILASNICSFPSNNPAQLSILFRLPFSSLQLMTLAQQRIPAVSKLYRFGLTVPLFLAGCFPGIGTLNYPLSLGVTATESL
jgi:hypothetical protein